MKDLSLKQALALLERAQRIEPDSAEIYVATARTHKAKGDAGQARAVAERGMLYCGGTQCEALRAFIPRGGRSVWSQRGLLLMGSFVSLRSKRRCRSLS